jgi:hypothetical protein
LAFICPSKFAILTALRTFHHYLRGQEVLLGTDNAAVSWMKNLKKPTGQTARWLQELGTYNLTVTHRAGRKHSNADALSRRPCKSCERQELGNEQSDDDNDKEEQELNDEANNEIEDNRREMVRVCTRSQTQPIIHSGYILNRWDPSTIRQLQLEDPDLCTIFTSLENRQAFVIGRRHWSVSGQPYVLLSSYMFLALVTISLSDLLFSLGFSSKKQLHCLYGVGLPVRIGNGETF